MEEEKIKNWKRICRFLKLGRKCLHIMNILLLIMEEESCIFIIDSYTWKSNVRGYGRK
jgi:hypothetical protein